MVQRGEGGKTEMYIELSYEFDKNMPIYPGSPKEEIIPITRMNQGDPSNTTTITHFLHNGTHVDASFHFYNNGSTIDQIPTFMLGFNAEDIHFEEHLQEGPYFVIGDCTPNKYKDDQRTIHIKGYCPGPAIPEIILKNCKTNEGDEWK